MCQYVHIQIDTTCAEMNQIMNHNRIPTVEIDNGNCGQLHLERKDVEGSQQPA